MDPEDIEPRKTPAKPRDLTALSIKELEDYVADMEAEIARARAMIDQKTRHRSGADALFRK